MTPRKLFAVLTLLLATAGVVFADDQEMSAAPEMTAEQQAAMEAMTKAATPGEHHQHLDHLAGNWTYELKMSMEPGAPPIESSGKVQSEWVLGGRFLEAVVTGEFMGQPFEGHSTDGYDNVTGTHFSFWVDNMGTMPIYATGSCSDGGKVIKTSGTFVDPVSGKTVHHRSVTTVVDHDHHTMEMYHSFPGEAEMKVLDLHATRQ